MKRIITLAVLSLSTFAFAEGAAAPVAKADAGTVAEVKPAETKPAPKVEKKDTKKAEPSKKSEKGTSGRRTTTPVAHPAAAVAPVAQPVVAPAAK